MMRRRQFIVGLGSAAAWPVVARAQQRRALPVIGILGSASARNSVAPDFIQGLKELGFVEGENVAFEQRWADNQYDRLPALATELVRARVALIVALGNNLTARAAKNATSTIPIVFVMGADPVQLRLVDGLSRPGGNITGVTTLASDQIQKRLQLLHDTVPSAKVFGFLTNPENSGRNSTDGRTAIELAQDMLRSFGGTMPVAQTRTISDFDAAVASLAEKHIEALATSSDALFGATGSQRLVSLAAKFAIPMIYAGPTAPREGGLMSYSASLADAFRQSGRYAGRILKGEKPSDMPVQLPTKFELVINLKTAKALGLTIPPGVLAIADEVID
jgi:putative ABC transport system substrate-binding protein